MQITIKVGLDGCIYIHKVSGPFRDYSPSDKVIYDPINEAYLIWDYGLPVYACTSIKGLRSALNENLSINNGIIICILLQCAAKCK